MIRVAIIEDQKEIREMLCYLVGGTEGLHCVQAFESPTEAVSQIPKLSVDVALVDIHMSEKNGIDCVAELKPVCPDTQFLMCTSLDDSEHIFKALKAGANGYITKSSPPSKIIDAIFEIHRGGSPMSMDVARKVVHSFHEQKQITTDVFLELSTREQEILTFLSKGLRYKEIAEKLFISTETVRTHIRNIYEKLQVNSRTEAINKVFQK